MEKFDSKKIIIIAGVLLVALVAIFVSMNLRTCTVTFDSKMGTSIQAQEVKVNDTVKVPNAPVMTGYVFEGWYLNDEEFNFDTKITEDITLTAKWSEIGN